MTTNKPAASKPAAIFWDMDGTLTDSEPLWAEATYFLSEQMGRRLTPTERLATVGATFSTTFRYCAQVAGIKAPVELEEDYRRAMFEYTKELFSQRLEVFPGIRDLLAQFGADGIPMMVTTNTERNVADAAIDAVGREHFVDTICGDEVEHGKPAPDMYREAARRLGLDPAQCLVFEDSATGMRAAVDAGCRVIGLPADESVEVPREVSTIAELYRSAHLDGVQAVDVYGWFGQISWVGNTVRS
ncbi:HAD family hydrolase [Corynebacterium flavescens]|uniref:HAD family hydrolase n=1 Tax=Corynebacterium flavescens TaxID=28028 RepID=UPI0028A2A1CE|nr:HAD family phosphatase [Corynebacterium flavescens]